MFTISEHTCEQYVNISDSLQKEWNFAFLYENRLKQDREKSITWNFSNSKSFLYFCVNIALWGSKRWLGKVLAMQAGEHEFWYPEHMLMPDTAVHIYTEDRKSLEPVETQPGLWWTTDRPCLKPCRRWRLEPELVHWHPHMGYSMWM